MNYKRIEVPGQGVIEFPDSMSDEEIEKVIKEKFFSAPQEIITKRDQSTVRKAERQIRKKNLEVQAQEQHQKDVQNYLGEGGTVEKSYYQMSGEFYGTFGNMLSGVNRLARKVLGDTAVDAIESVPVAPTVLNAVPSGLTPIANILSATSAGKWLNKDHKDLREYVKGGSKDAKQVSSQLQGSENVAKVAGVAGQVGAFIPLAVTGPAAPYLTVAGAGVQSFDSTYDDSFDAYKRMGFGDDEADKSAFKVSTGAGLITGTVTGMFNKYGGKFFGGVFGKGVERGFSKPVLTAALDMARQGTMKQVAKNVLKEVTGEATEESIDQLLQVSLSYVSYRPDVTLQEAMWEVMEAGLLGGVGGGMGGGPFSVYQDLKYKKQRANIAYNAEVKARTDRSRQRYDGQQLQTLIDGGVDVEGNEVAANPTLANLKDAEGRVVVFSHQDVDVEGKPSDEKLGYVQLDENADIDAVVAHYEMENPNAHFRGAFDLSKKDGSKHFDGGVEETAADMDPDKMDIEERVETEVKALGDEVFDPVKLGKRRIRKADLEQLYGGSVSETDQGYSVKLDNGMQVDLNFDEKFFELDTQEKIDQFEQSISAKMNIPLEEIQAMEPEARQEFRDQFTGAGANLQMQIDGKPVDGKFVQYFSRKADLQTAKHEAIHFLRQSGLVTEQEFNTLAERFAPDAKTEQDKEEAIAYAFEQYHAEAEERRQENRIGVFERVKNFFSKADTVDNVSGIFNAIERGEVARRAAPVSEPAKDLMEASDTLPAVTIPLPETEQEVDIDAEPAPIEPEPVNPQFSVELSGTETINQKTGKSFGDLSKRWETKLTKLSPEQIEAKKEFFEKGFEAPRFKKWFGEGAVVNEDGQPKVMYHGSPDFGIDSKEEINEKNLLEIEDAFRPRIYKEGFFLTPDVNFANKFGTGSSDAGIRKIDRKFAMVTNIKNPFDYDNPQHVDQLHEEIKKQSKKLDRVVPSKEEIHDGHWNAIEESADLIKNLGFDGYYVKEEAIVENQDSEFLVAPKNLAVFDSNNVKIISMHTVGTFDPSRYDVRYSVQDSIRGVNVNQGGTTFADSIVDGEKTIETRDSDSLRPVVGERIRIIRTGQPGEPAAYIGEVTVGEPKLYKNEEDFRADQDLHRVPPGNKFDIKEGKFKWGYPLEDAVRYEKEIIAPKLRGRVMTKPEQIDPNFSVQLNESTIYIPRLEDPHVNLPHGKVENQLHELFKTTANPTSEQLSKILGSPSKRKDKTKLDKNVKPTSYAELRKMLEWGITNSDQSDWYDAFGDGFRNLVGDPNIWEAAVIFGITSQQNAAEMNYADTLHVMALARQHDPVNDPAGFEQALRTTPKPEGHGRLKIQGSQIKGIINFYKTGIKEGGLKTTTYMQMVHDRGFNIFNPFSVQDVHMSRAFGYRYTDVDKDTDNVVDAAKFPSDKAIRYGMYLTTKLANEYNMRPDQVQALIWFYAKSNLSPKKVTKGKKQVGDGTFESANRYAQPEIAVIESMKSEGTFDSGNPYNRSTGAATRPSSTSSVISDPWSNSNLYLEPLLKVIEEKSPNLLVDPVDGNERGFGLPAGATLKQANNLTYDIIESITDGTGNIKFLNSIGVPHTVSPVVGVGSVNSPGIELTFTGSTLDSADRLAPVMGDAMLADKVSVSQPIYGSDGFGMKLNKPDNSPFSKQELAKMHKLAGRNFTITQDGTGIKILDENFYKKGKKYAAKDLDIFVESLKPLIDGAGLSVGIFSQKGKQYEHSGYQEAVQETWSKVPPAQRSDIQRSAVDELYKPIWTTYQNFFQKNKLKPVATKPAPHLDIQFSVQDKLSPEVEARINSIEGAREIPKDEQPKYEPDLRGKWAAILGRPSSALGYVGGPDLLRDKNELMLESAYQAKAVNKMTNDLQNKMLNDAYASVEGWKFPKWMKVGKWSKRLKQFQKDSLPIAAHLNATARDSGSGEFTFADFDMRAGMMPVAQFKKAEHKVGDVIEVSNPLSGEMEFLTIGGFVNAQGRVGYQLTRKMTAEMQTELYNHYKKEYADMIWLVEMFIDPNLKGMTKEVGGVRVPLFNRFSLEEVMKQTDEDFEGIAAYTPDVLATRTLKGIVDMVMNPTKVGKSPGRKYKTGKSRESGNVRDLLTGFNIRTFQAINESANKHFAEMVFEKGVEAMPKEGVPNGYVKLDRGIEDLMGAIKAYRYYENPQPGEPGYSEAAARLSELDNPENYSALLGEAYKRKGGNYIIRKDLVKLLTNKFSHSSQQNRFMRMINWGIRNSTQGFLIHPYSYVVNMLTNDYFAVEASFHRGFRGMAQILSKQTREMGKADLDHAGRILGGMFINRAAGIRQLMGFKTQYDQVVENILPDEVFENSTALADLKVSYDTGWFEYLKQGEIGAAGLQAIKYGDIDLRPKQRLAFAYLKSQAVRRAKKKGLTGKALKDSVDSYLLNPPKEDRIEAVNQAQFEFLNYADSPQLLQDLTKHDVSRLILQYPRFGYHYMHKQADRLKAVKDIFGRNMPPGKRADALAHFVTFATFTGGLGGMALHYALKAIAGDDEDDSAQYIGNYQIKYKDPITGEVKTKKIDYSMITSNRINLSKYFEALGIGDGDGEDFWWRVRNYPMIAMAGAAVQATEDTKKFGIQHGLATYFGMAKDLGVDMTTIGSGLKVGSKALASMKSMDSGRPERPFFDPYGATVPFSFYITESAMSSLVPFKRQFDEVSLMIDPIHRRRTASRQLNYEPGPWEAIRQGHAGGAVDRILTALGAVDPLPPGGKVENVSKSSMSTGQTSKSRATRREAKQKLDTSHAGQYYDTHGNLRLGVVPEANIRKQEGWQTAAKMGGFNLKQIDRRLYLDQLGPPKKKKSKFKVR